MADTAYDPGAGAEILSLARPWAADAQSIYEFLREVVTRKGQYWDEPDGLPDDPPPERRNRPQERRADGPKAAAGQLIEDLRELVQQPSSARLARLYEELLTTNVQAIAEPLDESLKGGSLDEVAQVCALGRMLATEAPRRGPVVFGIAILGAFGDADDADLLAVLGVCHTFAHAVLPALKQLLPDPEDVFVEIARHSNSWAKVDFVTELCQTNRADIKRWLLLEGSENSLVAYETARLCAERGGLKEMLGTILDTPELDAVSRLMVELIRAHRKPGGGISELADRDDIVPQYLEQALRAEPTFDLVVGLAALRRSILDGLAAPTGDAPQLVAACDSHFARDDVRARLQEWRISPERYVAWAANKAVTEAGIRA